MRWCSLCHVYVVLYRLAKVSDCEAGQIGAVLVVVHSLLSLRLTPNFVAFFSVSILVRNGIFTYDLAYTMNGCLTGLVSITGGCATVEPWAAVLIGITGGWFYLLGSNLLVKFRIDDAVDAIPVHMVGGMWGVLATGLFTAPNLLEKAFGQDEHYGWFYELARDGGDFTLMGIQIIAVLFIFGWTFVTMGVFFVILNWFGKLRINALEEEVGMDMSFHKGAAYNLDGSAAPEAIMALDISRSGNKVTKKELDDAKPVVSDEGDDAKLVVLDK
jgi:Amt family ammonium transporter